MIPLHPHFDKTLLRKVLSSMKGYTIYQPFPMALGLEYPHVALM